MSRNTTLRVSYPSSFTRHPSRALTWAALACCGLLAACQLAPPSPEPAARHPAAQCAEVFRLVDQAVAEAGVSDGMAARVAGFPYLRVDRFLASYAGQGLSEAQFMEWRSRMIGLGARGYAVELANLPSERAEALGQELWRIDSRFAWPRAAVAECAVLLASRDLLSAGQRAALEAAARVPDEYLTWQRVLGLYWLTRLPFAAGIRAWHDEVRATFALDLAALPLAGELKTYAPPPGPRLGAAAVAAILDRSSANALGIPEPRGAELEVLFRLFAPEFVIDTASGADRPGTLGWYGGAAPSVNFNRPVVYRRISHTRYGGRPLLQLVYTMWFPERPRGAGWDILGGHLDGITWRVTLAPDGEPWLFDSIHPCGCYHEFFPTGRAAPRQLPVTLDETAFVPQTLPRVLPGERIVLRVAAGTHYLQRVSVERRHASVAAEYALLDDDELRSLPLASGRRSLFRPDGIVAGSERDERYYFWPMGVPEPGAMRQWGRHATAFVGRRHFDDPDLLERHFLLKQP